jgi:hypothetical protein
VVVTPEDRTKRADALTDCLRFELQARALLVQHGEGLTIPRQKTVLASLRGAAGVLLRLRPYIATVARELPDPDEQGASQSYAIEAEHMADRYYAPEKVS